MSGSNVERINTQQLRQARPVPQPVVKPKPSPGYYGNQFDKAFDEIFCNWVK